MAFSELYDFSLLINETEKVVIEELERQLENPLYGSVCRCQDCILDMATYALNHLKPAYRSTLRGAIYAQALHDGEYRDTVVRIVTDAIVKISGNPSHE